MFSVTLSRVQDFGKVSVVFGGKTLPMMERGVRQIPFEKIKQDPYYSSIRKELESRFGSDF
jgi:hypothetical protein